MDLSKHRSPMSDTCAAIQEILSAKLDGESTVSEDQMAALHLESCTGCQAYSDMLEDLSFTMLREGESDADPAGEGEEFVFPTFQAPDSDLAAPVLPLDSKLWLLMMAPSLGVLLGTAALLSEDGGGSWQPLLPLVAFLPATLAIARSLSLSNWSRLRPVAALALLSPFLGPLGNLVLLLLMALAVRAPRPSERTGRGHVLGGLLVLTLVEALLRSSSLIGSVAAAAQTSAAARGALDLQLLSCSAVLLVWLATFRSSKAALATAGSVTLAIAAFAFEPLHQDFQRYRHRLEELPEPRPQYWYTCLKMGPPMEIATRHFERWYLFNNDRPDPRAVISGKIGSWKGTVDRRAIIAMPWPDLSPNFKALPVATVRKKFEQLYQDTDHAVARRLDGSFAGYLAGSDPAPLTYNVISEYDFQLAVPPGDYVLAFERKPNELLRRYADWHKVKAEGRLTLGEGNYWPEVVFDEPINLDFGRGLEGWEDNETATVTASGLRIASPPFWPRQQGIKQKFVPRALGGENIDEVRVTVKMASPSPQGQLKVSGETEAGDYDQEEAPTSKTLTSVTLPLDRELKFVEISVEYAAKGPPLEVRSLLVEGLAKGKVLRRYGGVAP